MRAVDIFGTTCKSFWNEDGSNMFIRIVFQAVVDASVPHRKAFKFNNSALYSEIDGGDTEDEDSTFNMQFWAMGVKCFSLFFKELVAMEARSLNLTREVLKERERALRPLYVVCTTEKKRTCKDRCS